jgi:hypothetical protein
VSALSPGLPAALPVAISNHTRVSEGNVHRTLTNRALRQSIAGTGYIARGTRYILGVGRWLRERFRITNRPMARPATLGGRSRPRTDETSRELICRRIRHHVDTLIVIPNQTLFRVENEKTTLGAFSCLLLGCSTPWFRLRVFWNWEPSLWTDTWPPNSTAILAEGD